MKKLVDWIRKNLIIIITIVVFVLFLYFAVTFVQQKWPFLITVGILAVLLMIMEVIGLLAKKQKK